MTFLKVFSFALNFSVWPLPLTCFQIHELLTTKKLNWKITLIVVYPLNLCYFTGIYYARYTKKFPLTLLSKHVSCIHCHGNKSLMKLFTFSVVTIHQTIDNQRCVFKICKKMNKANGLWLNLNIWLFGSLVVVVI